MNSMTKEELYKEINRYALATITIQSINNSLDEFFKDKVIIQRGENCHPYHMELHQWAENPLIDLQVFNESKGEFTLSIMDEYRIKPSEPVYEWQYTGNIGGVNITTEHLTDKEFLDSTLQYDYFEKDESTKRERK